MRSTERIYITAETLRAPRNTNEATVSKKLQKYVLCEGKEFFYFLKSQRTLRLCGEKQVFTLGI
jgi:hypothetical protein